MLSSELLHHIAIARLVLFGSVGVFITLVIMVHRVRDAMNGVCTEKSNYLKIFAIAIGVLWAINAATLLFPGHTLLWGNQGDEAFQIAFMERVISGHPFTDFFYKDLAPFYPPLYFWIFGSLGRIFNWDGISAAQWGVVLTYALLPLLALVFTQACRWTYNEQKAALVLTIASLLLLPTEALFLKPYEAAAAVLSVLWIVAFAKMLHEPSRRLPVLLGITGGIIFLLYYFWFALLIPAMIFLGVYRIKGERFFTPTFLQIFFLIGTIVTFVASPFLVPYLINLITLGQENFQAVYFFPSDARIYAPWLSFSLFGLAALGSMATYAFHKEWSTVQKAMLALGGSMILWHVAQLGMLALGAKSIMLSKPFLFLGGAALLFPLVERIVTKHAPSPRAAVVAVLVLAPLLPNGLFLDDAKVQAQLEQSIAPRTSAFVAENIRVFVPDYADRTWLVSGLQDLNGILPLTHYLAWNPHFSHPSAHWQSRLKKIEEISQISEATDATEMLDALGIHALLFYKAVDETGTSYYPFFYEEDAWPNGTQSKEIRIPTELIDQSAWRIAHEDNEWVIFIRE